MKIIVMGCGRVGSQVSLLLDKMGHNVTVIDHRDTDALLRLGTSFKGKVINGLGFDENILFEAGIKQADAFIAASFRWSLPDTAQMAFMVLGPMFDIKLLLMYLTVFRKKVIIALSLSTILAVLMTMLALQTFFPQLFLSGP